MTQFIERDGLVRPRLAAFVKVGDIISIDGYPFKVLYIHDGENRMTIAPEWAKPKKTEEKNETENPPVV